MPFYAAATVTMLIGQCSSKGSGCAQMFCPEGGKMLKPHETSESSPPKASLSVQSPGIKSQNFSLPHPIVNKDSSSDAAMASITSNLKFFSFYCLILLISFHSMLAAPLETYQEVSVKDSIPPYNLQFSPEKNPEVPIKRGEKRKLL